MVIADYQASFSGGDLPIHIRSLKSALRVENSTLTGFTHPIKVERMQCSDCALELVDVTLEGPAADDVARGGSVAVTFNGSAPPDPGGLRLERVKIVGFEAGVRALNPARVELRDVALRCMAAPLYIGAPSQVLGPLVGENVTATADGGPDNDCTRGGERGIRLSVLSATLADVSVSGYETGIWGTVPDGIQISDCTLTNNDVGIEFENGGLLTLERCSFTENVVGLRHGDELLVRGSSFVGNQEYGVYIGSGPTADLRCNWWGSEHGPRMYISSGMTSPGDGDVVFGSADVVPFLTEPPSEDADCRPPLG